MRRRDVPAGPASARERSSRRSVLLTTEAGPSSTAADLAAGVRTLVAGLSDVDFVVWTLSTHPGSAIRQRANVVQAIEQPAWNAPEGSVFGTRPTHRRRPSTRDVERSFVPALRSFLETTIDANGPGEPLAAALLDLRDYFRRWDPAHTWRSPLTWDIVRDHVLVRTPDAGGEDVDPDAPEAAGWSNDDLPTVGEAAQALAWLARMLSPLTIEVPAVDVVHATTAGFSAIPGVIARLERGTPLLLTELGVAPRDLYLDLQQLGAPFHLKRFAADVAGALARTVYRVADRIAPASRHTMRWELAYGAARTSMEVVLPGVDDEEYRPMEVPRTGRPTVVQASRIEPGKDQMTMLRVADLVRREVPGVVFLQFGEVVDRSYWEEIRAERKRLGLEDAVRFVGPAAEPPRALALGDVALVTSRSESFPRSVLEAAMCGLPVVATDVGGIREALNGAGIVAPAGDAEALADGVAAELRISPEQRERVRQAAREQAVARFGLRRFLDDHRRLYDGLGAAPVMVAPSVVEPEPAADVPAQEEPVVQIPEAAEPDALADADEAPPEGTGSQAGRRPVVPEGIEIVIPGAAAIDRLEIVEQPDVEPEADVEEPAEEQPRSAVDAWLAAAWDPAQAERPGAVAAGTAAAWMRAAAEPSGEQEAEPADDPPEIADVTPESAESAPESHGELLESAAVDQPEPVAPENVPPAPEPEPAPVSEPEPQPEAVPARTGRGERSDLRARLSDPDPAVRAEALRGLEAPTSADFAVAALDDENDDVRREAASALGRLNGPRAGRWLNKALTGDPSPAVRGEAVAALASLLTRGSGPEGSP